MQFAKHLAIATLLAGSTLAWAQHQGMPTNPPAGQSMPMAAPMADAMTEGEIRKIDKAAKKITLKHGEIRNLDMMPMTMVFRVENPAVLDQFKVGDKVRFTADEVKGALVLKTIEAAK